MSMVDTDLYTCCANGWVQVRVLYSFIRDLSTHVFDAASAGPLSSPVPHRGMLMLVLFSPRLSQTRLRHRSGLLMVLMVQW